GNVTYEELLALVERCAGGLIDRGVQREMRVLLVMLDSVEFAVAFLGALRIGAIPVPVNPLLPGRDLGAMADDAGAVLAVLSSERLAVLDGLVTSSAVRTVVVTGDVELPEAPVPLIAWDDLLERGVPTPAVATVADPPGL